jgi:hypothetical protein
MDRERGRFSYLLQRDANIPKNDPNRYTFQHVHTLPIACKGLFYMSLYIQNFTHVNTNVLMIGMKNKENKLEINIFGVGK